MYITNQQDIVMIVMHIFKVKVITVVGFKSVLVKIIKSHFGYF
jgi:hypothetical protein